MTTDNASNPEQNNGGSGDYTPPATQEELNDIIKTRLERERRKFEDYEELRAKAARLDEIEEANLSDLTRETQRAERAEQQLAELRKAITLREIADEYGITKEDLEFIDGPDEDAIRAKAERLATRLNEKSEQEEQGYGVARVGFTLDGAQPPAGPASASREETARAFFGI